MGELATTMAMAPQSRQVSFEPSSLNETARTVDVVWTTGARVLRGIFEQYYEELSLDPASVRMGRLTSGTAPLLDAHRADGANSAIGVVTKARLLKERGIATIRFTKQGVDSVADSIWQKIRDGILRNISVGYRIYRAEKVMDGEGTIPVFRAMDWEPFELSVVTMGADAEAGFRGAEKPDNECVVVTHQEKTMEEKPTIETTSAPSESAAVAATRAATTKVIEEAKSRAAAEAAAAERARSEERVRVAEIRKIAQQCGFPEEWTDKCITAGSSVADVRDAAFEALARRETKIGGFPSDPIRIADDERSKFIRGASAWLFTHTGVQSLLEAARNKDPEKFSDVKFDPGEFRGMSPRELARHCLERAHINTRGMDPMRMVGLALTQRSANYQTIGDFPTLLENVLNKTLLGAYALQENTWQRFCLSIDVSDFRTGYRYRSGSLPGLDVIPEHAEYKSGAIPDGSKYPVATQRMGKIVGLSREAIVNDDMGALTQIAMGLGAAAMRSIENAVYDLILANTGLGPTQTDSQPFFHANRANVNATGSALSEAGLDADRVVMRRQLDPNGLDYLELQPAVLLVADSLYAQARKINSSIYSTDSGALFQEPNIANGLFREVVGSPRLSGTRRYLFATTLDAIVVAFLTGQGRAPVVESMNGWRIDGVEWKVSLYAMAQMGDPKAAVTNAGT